MKTKLSRAKLNQHVIEEASAWFVDFRVGDIDAAAREQFSNWLRRSPEHIWAYLEIAETYVDLPASGPRALEVERLIAQARSEANVVPLETTAGRGELHSDPLSVTPRATRRTARRVLLAASVVLACCAAGWSAWLYGIRDPTYATQIGELRSITLADGSRIDLNALSRVRVRFTEHARDVDLLEGQALFQVAKDKTRPFIVRSDRMQIRAVGTQFDVHRRVSGTTITVVEGRVAVLPEQLTDFASPNRHGSRTKFPRTAGGSAGIPQTAHGASDGGVGSAVSPSAIFLTAGEQLTVTAEKLAKPMRANVAAATAWTARRLIFDGSRLTEVAEEFNRYNRRQLIIENAELDDFHISGVYSSTDPTSLVRFLRDQPGVTITETDREIRISRK